MGVFRVHCKGDEIGDSLCMIPVLQALALLHEHVHVLWDNPAVARIAILPENVRSFDTFEPFHPDLVLNAHLSQITGKKDHACTHLGRLAGLDVKPPSERFVKLSPDPVLEYDFLIAPFSRDPRRACSLYEYGLLFFAMHHDLGADTRIGILGGPDDPRPWDGIEPGRAHEKVEYLYGLPLDTVASLMRRTRIAVITIDSAMNRLAHAAAIDNHILICSSEAPFEWQTWPLAYPCWYGPTFHPYSAGALMAAFKNVRDFLGLVPA